MPASERPLADLHIMGGSRCRGLEAVLREFEQKEVAMMIDIPVNAKVECADGHGGRSTCVVLNPNTQRLTHLVVKESKFPRFERLVTIHRVEGTTPTSIYLSCTRDELAAMEHFIDHEFSLMTEPFYEHLVGVFSVLPYSFPAREEGIVEHERIQPGELAVSRDARVEATDGCVGRVDEFLMNPKNGHITHLAMREGHLWGQKEVAIPVSGIDRMKEDTVYLKLDKGSVGKLPSVPIRRWVKERSHNIDRFDLFLKRV